MMGDCPHTQHVCVDAHKGMLAIFSGEEGVAGVLSVSNVRLGLPSKCPLSTESTPAQIVEFTLGTCVSGEWDTQHIRTGQYNAAAHTGKNTQL